MMNDEKDVWFVGFMFDFVVGVYIGYDNLQFMGCGGIGGYFFVLIFNEFMQDVDKDIMFFKFIVFEGMKLIVVDCKIGMQVGLGDLNMIVEVFKFGIGLVDVFFVIGGEDYVMFEQIMNQLLQVNDVVKQGQLGLF